MLGTQLFYLPDGWVGNRAHACGKWIGLSLSRLPCLDGRTWGQSVALRSTLVYGYGLHSYKESINDLSPSANGGIRTLGLRIVSRVLYHCATAAGREPKIT